MRSFGSWREHPALWLKMNGSHLSLAPRCAGWQGCCLSCTGQFLQWCHYPPAIWQAKPLLLMQPALRWQMLGRKGGWRQGRDLTSCPLCHLVTFLWLVSLTNRHRERTVSREMFCKDTGSGVCHPLRLGASKEGPVWYSNEGRSGLGELCVSRQEGHRLPNSLEGR